MEKELSEVLLYFVPALLVLFAMFMLVRKFTETQQQQLKKFFENEQQNRTAESRNQHASETLPLKLQAIERMVLFLERISPNSLLLRVHRSGMSAAQLQADLSATLRAEFEHNLSQQIYISEDAWEEIKSAKEDMSRLINMAYGQVGNQATGIQMSSQIFELAMKLDALPTQRAIQTLKEEAKKLLT